MNHRRHQRCAALVVATALEASCVRWCAGGASDPPQQESALYSILATQQRLGLLRTAGTEDLFRHISSRGRGRGQGRGGWGSSRSGGGGRGNSKNHDVWVNPALLAANQRTEEDRPGSSTSNAADRVSPRLREPAAEARVGNLQTIDSLGAVADSGAEAGSAVEQASCAGSGMHGPGGQSGSVQGQPVHASVSVPANSCSEAPGDIVRVTLRPQMVQQDGQSCAEVVAATLTLSASAPCHGLVLPLAGRAGGAREGDTGTALVPLAQQADVTATVLARARHAPGSSCVDVSPGALNGQDNDAALLHIASNGELPNCGRDASLVAGTAPEALVAVAPVCAHDAQGADDRLEQPPTLPRQVRTVCFACVGPIVMSLKF
jgi:hypothetical protein